MGLIRCNATAVLSADEHALIEALPEPAHEYEPRLRCELESSHPGSHHALAQSSAGENWWLRWDANGQRDLHVLPRCPDQSQPDSHGETEPCILFDSHPGAHDFMLA